MKKILLRTIGIIIAIIVLWAGFNLLTDIDKPEFEAAKGYDTSNIIRFLKDLFPPVPVTRDNGFYRLWTLAEPEDVDIDSDELLEAQKKLNDPETATVEGIKAWADNTWLKKKDKFNRQLRKKREAIFKMSSSWDNYPQFANKDWGHTLLKEKVHVLKMQKLMKPLLDRYEDVIDSKYFEDYTLIVVEEDKINFTAPIPNLLAWLYTAKQYIAMKVVEALEGDWVNAVSRIIDHLEFTKKATSGGRTLIVNLIGKAVSKISLAGLTSIMNQPDCPEEVYTLILKRIGEIRPEEYGSEKPLLAEGFWSSQKKSINPFWQNNRTKKYSFDFLTKVIQSEKIPPYQWGTPPNKIKKVKKGFFWWIQNPLGKNYFEEFDMNFPTVVLKSWHLKVMYDLVRISAELHLKYNPEMSVQENLDGLDLYKTLLDPCSGKPYIWHAKKQMLYSYGADRDDDGGKDGPLKSWDADFFVPVHLYVK